jgi:GPH family glycoside/pentoside/hexuronide:cation symporter
MNSVEQASPVADLSAVANAGNRSGTSTLLTFKEKLGYGLGDTASHFVWDMVGFWLLFFYTDVYKIPAAAAGTIMLIARFWDMGIDPVIGIISDRTKTRWGKFRPYILFGAVPYAVLAILTFTTPNLGETGKIIYAGATYVLLMTAYAAVNLPYSSLAAVMTSDTYERAGLNTYRFICAFTGQFVVSGLALTLAKYFGNGDKAAGFQYTLVMFGFLSVVFFFITFATSKERVQPSTALPSSLKEDLKNLFKNRPWMILACVGIISFVMFAMQNAAIAYYFKYYIGKEDNVQLFNVIGTVALIVALPLSKPLAKAFGNRNVFIASSLISGICFIAIYLPSEKDLVTIYVLNILAKMAYAPAVPLLWTMIADSSDYSEWKTGRRATGLYFSAATFAQKAGWGIGAAIAGWILTVYNYVPDAVQTATSIHGIKLLVSVIPGILYMSCAIFMFFYTIDSKTTDLMKKDLDARRAQV